MEYKELTCQSVKDVQFSDSKQVLSFVITDESIDTDQEILKADGLDAKNYMRNPVVLANHKNDTDNIVGRVRTLSRKEDQHIAQIEFMPKEMNARSHRFYEMAKGGWLNSVSVGFITNKSQKNADGIREITNWTLKEISLIPVGANQNAILVGKSQSKDQENPQCFACNCKVDIITCSDKCSDIVKKVITEQIEHEVAQQIS